MCNSILYDLKNSSTPSDPQSVYRRDSTFLMTAQPLSRYFFRIAVVEPSAEERALVVHHPAWILRTRPLYTDCLLE